MCPAADSPAADAAALAAGTAAAAAARGEEADIRLPLADGEALPARVYGMRKRGTTVPLVLHFHGGSFLDGDLDSGRNVARLLARAGTLVLSVAYPKEPFPRPIEVGYQALEWLHRQRVKLAGKGARVFLAGEEAGGNVAAGVALVARDRAHPPLAGQVLLSPMLDPCAGTPSLRRASGDAAPCRWAAGWQEYLRQPSNTTHPYAVPGASLRLAALAPTLVLVGHDDAMRDEALTFAQRLRDAGIPVTSQVLPSPAQAPEAVWDPACGQGACPETAIEHLRQFFAAHAHDA